MNLEIEEISDPCHPNLLNMPKVAMEEVLKNLDCGSIFRLRKVCRTLRFSMDEIDPELHLISIRIELPLTTSSVESYLEDIKESRKEDLMNLHRPRTGCRLDYKQGYFYKFAFISMEDAETLLKNTKLILEELDINLCFTIEAKTERIEKKEEDLKKFHESMKSLLENRRCLLKTKKIQLEVHHLSEAADLLKCIDPKSLETISIRTRIWDAPQAMEIDSSEYSSPIESFASFKTVSVQTDKVTIENLSAVKELFVRSPKMETFIVKSNKIRRMQDQLKLNFDQFDSYGEEFEMHLVFRVRSLARSTWTWLKNVSDSTKKLQITLNVGYKNYIKFSKV